jgi:flagellar hook-length control protein FliK
MTSAIASNILNNAIVSTQTVDNVGMDKTSDFTNILDSTLELTTIGDIKNVENSLDLTLARDIHDIIAQLKDALTDGAKETEKTDTENLDLKDITEDTQASFSNFEQLLCGINNLDKNSNQILTSDDDTSIIEFDTTKLNIDTTEIEVPETETKINFNKQENTQNNDLRLDEDMVKELNIESIKAETDCEQDNSGFMNSQTPQEQVVKMMISQDVKTFEPTMELSQATQTSQVEQDINEISSNKIIEQITKQMDSFQNNTKVNIVLNPESLGKVTVQIAKSPEGLSAQFTTTTQEAKDLIMKGLDGLKDSLISQGVGVDNVTVKLNETQESTYNKDWTKQDGSRGGNKEQRQQEKQEKEQKAFEQMMEEKFSKA